MEHLKTDLQKGGLSQFIILIQLCDIPKGS